MRKIGELTTHDFRKALKVHNSFFPKAFQKKL